MNIVQKNFRKQLSRTFHRTSLSVLAATLATAPFIHTLDAIAAPSVPQIVAQVPQDWQTGSQLLRLLDNSGNLSSIGILFDVLNKPTTNYANVVYQLYVNRSGEWREVYTNSGARLLSNQSGRFTAPVEAIPLNSLSEKISLDDLYNGNLKAITRVRYDLPNGVKDASFAVEDVKSFSSIPTVNTSDTNTWQNNSPTANTNTSNNYNNGVRSDRDLGISNNYQTSSTQTSTVQTVKPMQPIASQNSYVDEDEAYDSNNNSQTSASQVPDGVELSQKNPHRGHFSLAVLQSPANLSQVIARISLKSKRPNGFLQERFVGDYRFTVNQRATFIRGLNPGDRIVVRLFDLQNRPLGYTEVQLLKDFAAVSLILPSDPSAYGTLRTVSGIDSQHIGRIDNKVKVYDYFTQIQSATTITETVVRFLTSSQGISTNLFNVAGLPSVPIQSSYTNAFFKGEQTLVERTISVFTRDMPPVMQVLPGQLAPLIPINDSNSTIDVVRKILDFKDLRPNTPTFF